MKIHGAEYTWNKHYKLDEGEGGCVYRVWCSDNYDPIINKTITYVVDIFSGAVAILDDLNIEDDILDEIVANLWSRWEYTNEDSGEWTYFITPINIWKLEAV